MDINQDETSQNNESEENPSEGSSFESARSQGSQVSQSQSPEQNSPEQSHAEQPRSPLLTQSRSTSSEQPRSQAARTRRLVSQSTFQENTLDNSVNNSQQQFIDLATDSSSDDSDDNEDPDQLFEEYLRENAEAARSQECHFDDELPMNHSYLGTNMENIRGTNFYDPGKIYEIPVCGHHSLVFPGEILPMIMVSESIFARTPDSNEGLTFGLVFVDEMENDRAYGVTCQVFEKGVDNQGHITVKSKARQRFVVIRTEDGLTTQRNHNYYAKVKILPEYILPDPITLNLSNNLTKFLLNPSQAQRVKKESLASMGWPKWVYDKYSIVGVNEKIERYLAMLSIEAPTDPILKSFWLARNVPLNQTDRKNIFTNNCVNKRMMLIAESLNFMCFFNCKRCRTKIAVYNDIFAMAKGNVNANYCNPAGYIHETLTVQKTLEDSIRMVDRPSTEFSWFPGYAWQIAVCSKCSSHVGWKFLALSKNLKPKTFFGLSCKSLMVSSEEKNTASNDENSDDSMSDDNHA